MNLLNTFSFSTHYSERGTGLPFGLAVISGADAGLAKEAVADAKLQALSRIEADKSLIRSRIDMFDSFFRRYGFKCPLPHQLSAVEKSGLPTISPFVDALLITELTHGLLMGIQDLDPIVNPLTYDLAAKGEQFSGMRGTITCRDNEMVVRDAQNIVASYFQGPDKRTSIRPTSRNLVFYAFAAPGISPDTLNDALISACNVFDGTCEASEHRVYST